jgi:chromosomal replication initiator protein
MKKKLYDLLSFLQKEGIEINNKTILLVRFLIEQKEKNILEKTYLIDDILKVVCDYFNMSVDSLRAKTRKREIVQARQLAMYFSKNMTKSSLASIGFQIGKKDHATVLHSCKTVNNLIETDKKFRKIVNDIEKKLNNF